MPCCPGECAIASLRLCAKDLVRFLGLGRQSRFLPDVKNIGARSIIAKVDLRESAPFKMFGGEALPVVVLNRSALHRARGSRNSVSSRNRENFGQSLLHRFLTQKKKASREYREAFFYRLLKYLSNASACMLPKPVHRVPAGRGGEIHYCL